MSGAPDSVADAPPVVLSASPAAASGPEHVSVPVTYDAILLASFGGPEGQDDVIPFLRNVTRGRGIPDERLEEVAHHYRAFGGVSPINAQNRQLKLALEAEIAARGIDLPVLWGNRNWDPYLREALIEAHDRGYRSLIAVATSAYSSYSSCRQYREDFAMALDETGLSGEITIDKVRQFFDHPGFVQPFVTGLVAALEEIQQRFEGIDLTREVEVLFTTHSIPSADAERSGPAARGFGPEGAYAAQHKAVAEVVMFAATAGVDLADVASGAASGTGPGASGGTSAGTSASDIPWQLVYQSRSGPPSQPWLEPDINDAIAELPARGVKAIVIVPLGFVSDHMEVMWDLDNEALTTSAEHGLFALRTPTPGVDPAYVSGLVDLVLERRDGTPAAERPAVTALGPWYDVCRPGCCENVRLGFKPAVSGIAP